MLFDGKNQDGFDMSEILLLLVEFEVDMRENSQL